MYYSYCVSLVLMPFCQIPRMWRCCMMGECLCTIDCWLWSGQALLLMYWYMYTGMRLITLYGASHVYDITFAACRFHTTLQPCTTSTSLPHYTAALHYCGPGACFQTVAKQLGWVWRCCVTMETNLAPEGMVGWWGMVVGGRRLWMGRGLVGSCGSGWYGWCWKVGDGRGWGMDGVYIFWFTCKCNSPSPHGSRTLDPANNCKDAETLRWPHPWRLAKSDHIRRPGNVHASTGSGAEGL